jgi:hypothetical protein
MAARLAWLLAVAVGAGCVEAPAPRSASPAPPAAALRGPEAFASIADPADRARAIFTEATRVMLHPRCANCHPAGDAPTQRDGLERHEPPVMRGEHDQGIPGLMCSSCHQDRNAELARVPGAPKWQLAPREMAWVGRSPHALCEQLKDPARNGHRTLDAVVDHAEHDAIVAWGWNPGADRRPVPGTQAQFGALMAAWVRDGAACPLETTASADATTNAAATAEVTR